MLAAALACAALSSAPASADVTELEELPHAASLPSGIAVGPDGAVWFTELGGDGRIARLAVDGTLKEFELPSPGSEPTSIVAGPDGNMWFTESGADRIGQITPGGVIREFGGLVSGASPQDITVGPDGALWFTEGGYNRGNRIGRIDPASGAVQEFCIRRCDLAVAYGDEGLQPAHIASGPDGRLWFTERNPDRGEGGADPYADQGTGYVAAMTTGGVVSEYAVPTVNAQPTGITAGPDGNMWFTEAGSAGNRVGQITTGGQITELGELPTPDSRPGRIVAPGDGRLWVAEGNGNRLAVIDTTGRGLELPELTTASAQPSGMAVDPAGTLWITELRGNRLAKTDVELLPKDTEPVTEAAPPVPPAAVDEKAASTAVRAGLSTTLAAIGRRLKAAGSARLAKLGRFGIVLQAPDAGIVSVRLVARGRNVLLGQARRVFKSAGSARTTLVLTRAGKRLLRQRRPVRATLKAAFVDAAGKRVTASRPIVLSRLSAPARRAPSRSA